MSDADIVPSRLQKGAGAALSRFMATVRSTSKVICRPADVQERLASLSPCVVGYWHGQFLLLPPLRPPNLQIDIIVARHADAEPLSQAIASFGMGLIRGAGAGDRKKDRGGAAALRLALRTLDSGRAIGCSLDAPPGPARICGLGIITIARLSGKPIVPVAIASSRFKVLDTWSRFTINLPFSTIGYVMGEPIHIPRDIDAEGIERYRLEVEAAMNAATRTAYELAGADITPTLPLTPTSAPARPGVSLQLYRAATSSLKPVAPLILGARERRGKEDPSRRGERLGIASQSRPRGRLAWFHAASVGETNAVLPILIEFRERHPSAAILLTTGTVTSARIAADRLGDVGIHQYVPLDVPGFVELFLDHWRPDLAVFVESEIWPNLVLGASRRNIPMLLANARMSPKSAANWRRRNKSAKALFSRFEVVLAQTPTLARQFTRLGARDVRAAGNLKIDSPPPPIDNNEIARLRAIIGARPVLLAASTHDNEEEMLAEAYRLLPQTLANPLLIIAPRHPSRAAAIVEQLGQRGLSVAKRSAGESPGDQHAVYLADTIGELGTFYCLASVAFVGGSLIPHGGQNPIEAIRLGAAVLTGPHWENFREVYADLLRAKGCREVNDAAELAATAAELLTDTAARDDLKARAVKVLEGLGGAHERTLGAIEEVVARAWSAAAPVEPSGAP